MKNFKINGAEVRTVEKEGMIYTVSNDLAKAFGYKNTAKIKRHIKEHCLSAATINTAGGKQKMAIINKSGLLSVCEKLKYEDVAKELIDYVKNYSVVESIFKEEYNFEIETIDESITFKDLSLLMNKSGVKIGRNELFAFARSTGLLLTSGNYWNRPSQEMVDMGHLEVRLVTTETAVDSYTHIQPLATKSGQIYIFNKYIEYLKRFEQSAA
ncbi:BRO family protein [Brochothrix thermosphacta]|uniref:Bro-N domain-containing protein n=1 Tax=Brochothrix thermosphacta TaxID=2756 RepID=A0A2X0S3B2_BROTH|nr:phage antirepressor KilAC domain-containing protein [Brochothrix thermosphacta]SPP28857.1 conserved hypothetical protein [Brochothrix thermosphacta]